MKTARAILLTAAWLAALPASAHKPSDSYLSVESAGERLAVRWDVSLKDLEYSLGLDADADGQITWGELSTQSERIAAYAAERLTIAADGREAPLVAGPVQATEHSDGGYAVLHFEGDAPGRIKSLTIRYSLFFDVDPTHRGLVVLTDGTTASTNVVSADARELTLRVGDRGLAGSFLSFVKEGVWHIWIGFDHILFLAALLLPAVLERREGRWRPVLSFRQTAASVLKIVTMFTLAHSITLWLAVTGYVTLPSRLVEASIALSIVITAANNLAPVLPLSNWMIALLFGLLHGFGFASVLTDLGLSHVSLAAGLLGFNVGVELGQLAIVLAFLPLAYALRETSFYRWGVFRMGSVAVGVLGAVWTVERWFNVSLLGI
jgi:hypothetical protein